MASPRAPRPRCPEVDLSNIDPGNV
eukprot:SM009464S24929  [mRNA]  locus=s9464:3:552:- [translate_table: standard]